MHSLTTTTANYQGLLYQLVQDTNLNKGVFFTSFDQLNRPGGIFLNMNAQVLKSSSIRGIRIDHLFLHHRASGPSTHIDEVFAVVRRFPALSTLDRLRDPYVVFKHLRASLVYCEPSPTIEVITMNDVSPTLLVALLT
ncbi:hypothetical protein BJ138DRAFT_1118900 [Hygrophoropsis aurantiaca]|uniref:Uncharacterized protein n=1 Tax=Hygrophoropsis aurantiaca TaxID=72124 RepID=A0ACB7ZUT5_9AGAM|nr:hypothetical protein BJ138DRAFT_1118900 [Hygrophoropsis aurantiaca]